MNSPKKSAVCRCENCIAKRRQMIADTLQTRQTEQVNRRTRASESRESLMQHLKAHNLEPVSMPGDGNCQFRAIAAYYIKTDHLKIRQDIVEYIWKNVVVLCREIFLRKWNTRIIRKIVTRMTKYLVPLKFHV